MGEIVVSSSEDVERKSEAVGGGNLYKQASSSAAKHGLSKWEKFLPKMALRVLLVEADDSTRQIITALLRKCRYRVAAVSDGLKAWEMLRDKPRNVDLILTEVELPSISGYALLTLIMEHEICKNIPVIRPNDLLPFDNYFYAVMSRQDNVTTVYRCMLRGAVDYLVKPIRRNELRNLWQHVWRRRSCLEGGKALQEYWGVAQGKVEGTSENNPATIHSSGNKTCVEISTEYVNKESDEQSSCTKPDLEAEAARMEDFSGKDFPNESSKHEAFINFSQKECMLETNSEAHVPPTQKSFESKDQGKDRNVSAETSNSLTDFPRVPIDFMGTSNSHEPSAVNVRSNLDSFSELNLSLRSSPTTRADENQGAKECPTLWHPKASAFTRYISKQIQDPCTSRYMSTSSTDQNKECGSNAKRTDCSSDTPSPTLTTQKSRISQATGQSKQSEVGGSCPQGSICPAPVPAKVISLNSPHNGYNFSAVPVLSMQSNPSSVLSPSSANPQQSFFHMNQHYHSAFESVNSGKFYDQSARAANCSATQPFCKPEKHPNGLMDMDSVPPANDQSMNSSLCNGSMSQLNNVGFGSACGSNSNPDQAAAVGNSAESKNEDSLLCPGGSLSRSTQREAALMKFRLKRKDRCFEKKVRYESRKKLAEQRPRVKGQFVRHGQNE